MLHAELHGKLSSETTDSHRREDILTSTVFGLLFATESWSTLVDWFNRARSRESALFIDHNASDQPTYWFWPRLDNAEPDLVVAVSGAVIIIEAKYFSGKSGSVVALGATHDQLAREWRACQPSADQAAYPDDLRRALESSEVSLIYLVRRRRWAHERDALDESLSHAPDARMFLLTWEDLDETLADTKQTRLVVELRRYLAGRDLAAFRGFHSCALSSAQSRLHGWKLHLHSPRTSPGSCLEGISLRALHELSQRRSPWVKS